MGLNEPGCEYPEGSTPLTRDEAEGLRPPNIRSRGELDRAEQENILEAEAWAFGGRHKDLLSEDFILKLHGKMFSRVWKWAGKLRTSDKNLGVPVWEIGSKLKTLCEDMKVWQASSSYDQDEACARFHHRLVVIHPFANGNGRHARLMADLLAVKLFNGTRFSWGSGSIGLEDAGRNRYLEGLRDADRRDFKALLAFIRS